MKILLTFTVLLLAVHFAFATVHNVPGTYSTIQAALNACATGDTVLVAPGTYYENITWPSTQSILLKSESGAALSIIDGGGIAKVISINTGVNNTTIIDGFTIKNGYAPNGGGIGCGYSSSPTIKNNIIIQNVAYDIPTNYGGGGGIAVGYNSSPIIIDNIISSNSATVGFGGGLACAIDCNPIIENNTFENNFSGYGGGAILVHTGCSATITNNIVKSNSTQRHGGGMYIWESTSTIKFNTIEDNIAEETGGGIEFGGSNMSLLDSNSISYNTAHQSGGGIGLHFGSMPTISNNVISNNTADRHGGGIYCTENSNPLITSNQITGNEADSVGGGVSCRYSFPTIQYNVIDSNISNAGGGGGICISYSSSPLVKSNDITYCQANGNSGGGGILIVYGSNAIIENNTISHNSCELGGGGILGFVGCSPYILGNTVKDNIAGGGGGGLCFQTTTSTVKSNLIQYNTSGAGAGIWSAWSDQSVIDSNDILENNGDGIFCKEGSTPLINRNNICGNKGYGVRNIDPSVTVNAKHNWWDHQSGPGGFGPGTGDSVSAFVDYDPWLTNPITNVESEYDKAMATDFVLFQNYPNPFNPSTTISYSIPVNTHIALKVYNVLGKEVLTFINEEQEAGFYEINFDAAELSSGIYLYQLKTGDFIKTKKMILLK